MATIGNQMSKWEKDTYHGGEYADYKLGTIKRIKVKGKYQYTVLLSGKAYGYKTLAESKKKIDTITNEVIKKYKG